MQLLKGAAKNFRQKDAELDRIHFWMLFQLVVMGFCLMKVGFPKLDDKTLP